jgi:hypothetical protein
MEIYKFQVLLFFKTLFNFEKEWCTFDMEKKAFEQNQAVIVALNMQKDF